MDFDPLCVLFVQYLVCLTLLLLLASRSCYGLVNALCIIFIISFIHWYPGSSLGIAGSALSQNSTHPSSTKQTSLSGSQSITPNTAPNSLIRFLLISKITIEKEFHCTILDQPCWHHNVISVESIMKLFSIGTYWHGSFMSATLNSWVKLNTVKVIYWGPRSHIYYQLCWQFCSPKKLTDVLIKLKPEFIIYD